MPNSVPTKFMNQFNGIEEMTNVFRNNPEIFRQYIQNVTGNNTNYNMSNPNYLFGAAKGNVPRNIMSQVTNQNNRRIIIDSSSNSHKINIKFETTQGISIIVIAPFDLKAKDLFYQFITKIGFDSSVLGKDIYFLYNAGRIEYNDERTLSQMKILDGTKIMVVDTKGLIGAN